MRLRLRRAGFLALAILAAACGGREPDVYPADVIENFLRSCTLRSDRRACRCAFDAVQRRFTLEEFQALETRMRGGEIPPELIEALAACR